MRRICSKISNLVAIVRNFEHWFKDRDYPENVVGKETKRALESPLLGCSKTSERSVSSNCGTGVPLLVNCNPIIYCLGQVICKNLCFYVKMNQYLTLPPLFHFVLRELLGAT